MENQENNNLNELDQLKAQYEELKQRFEQQEIVNEHLMKSTIQDNANYFSRYRKTVMIAYPILAVLGFAYFTFLGELLPFGLSFLLLMVFSIVFELWLTRNVKRQAMENADLLTLSKNMQKLKSGYAVYTVFIMALGFMFVLVHILKNKGYLTSAIAEYNMAPNYNAIWSICFVGLLLITFAVLAYRNFVSHCNNVIRQIESYDGKPQPKSPRTFLLFLGSMIAVFGIGILLVHFALRPTIYARAENDFTSEGKLEFWEVYADTIVYEKDVPALMETWQNSDSLVVMKGMRQTAEDNQPDLRLYALKKSNNGPAISSKVLGGKPLVQRVEFSTSTPKAGGDVPIVVQMMPEASALWSEFTDDVKGHNVALSMEGEVVQEWYVNCQISNGQFFFIKNWSSDDEIEEYCKKLSRQ
ncbi:MAG: hypothetical protein IKO34_05835 [Bacteroidales bacterium]|nr:hypothetical protein [Bacteroidales bacterium]